MSISHLDSDELDRVLSGHELAPERNAHLQACVACRRRRDAFLAVVAEAAGAEDGAALDRARGAALAAWAGPHGRHLWRWLVAAAAVLVLGLLPLLRHQGSVAPAIDADAVLQDVDRVLARDPLASLASEDVLRAVVPTGQESEEGGVS
jgi:hypothetical protein